MNEETATSPEPTEPAQDRSILDRILRNNDTSAPVQYVYGNCPNCAANGNESKLNNFVCPVCEHTTPVYLRPTEGQTNV